MINKYSRTNIFIVDKDLWNWAQYRARTLEYDSVSEYLFNLIKKDKTGLEKTAKPTAKHP